MAKKEHTKMVTPPFRNSFPAVFVPKKVTKKRGGQDVTVNEYSLSALFRIKAVGKFLPDHPVLDEKGLAEFQALRDLASAAAVAEWGADKTKWPANLQSPFRAGSEKEYDGYDEGVAFCTFKSEYKPGLVGPDLQEIISPTEFYGGCFARAKVHAYAWTYMGKNGVSFSLWHLQKVKDGKGFGGGGDASKEFDALPVPAGAAAGAPTPTPAATGGGFGL